MHAARGAELREHASDSAVRRVLHDPVALVDVEELQQADRAERHRDELGRALVGEGIGHGDESGGVRHDVLGPGAEGAAGRDALSDREVLDALTEGVDDAQGLGAGGRRQLGLEPIGAAHGPQVVVVDGGEDDAQADLPCCGLRNGTLLDREDVFGFAESGMDECTHDVVSFPAADQSSDTVIVTSMLPRVAFEYGQTWCAASASAWA